MKRIFLIVIFIVLLAGCSIPKYEGTEDKANGQDNVIENFMEKHNDGLKLWYIDGEGKE